MSDKNLLKVWALSLVCFVRDAVAQRLLRHFLFIVLQILGNVAQPTNKLLPMGPACSGKSAGLSLTTALLEVIFSFLKSAAIHSELDSNMGNRIYTKSNFGFNFGPSGYMVLKKCTHYKYWLNNYPIQKKLTSSLYEAI